MLGKESYGEYGIIISTITLVNSLAGFGAGLTTTKYVSELRAKDQERTGNIIGLTALLTWVGGTICAALFYISAPWLAKTVLAASNLTDSLRISSVCVLLGVVNGAQTAALYGFEAFKTNAKIAVVSGVIQVGLTLIGCWQAGLLGIMVGSTIGLAVNTVLNWNALRIEKKQYRIRTNVLKLFKEWRVLVSFTLPAFLGGITIVPAFWGCNAMLANQENGYIELGILNAANQWFSAVQFLPSVFGMTILPVLSERYGAGESAKTIALTFKMIRIAAYIIIPVVIVLTLFGGLIMRGYGYSDNHSFWTFAFTIATAGMISVCVPLSQIFVVRGALWEALGINLIWCAVLLACTNATLQWGALGLAASRLVAYGFYYAFLWKRFVSHNRMESR
jgi:O-antigen/teichoic acid export membrane protein